MTTTSGASSATLLAKTICISVKGGGFGNSKKASLADVTFGDAGVTTQPDKMLLRLSKTLLDSPELTAVDKHDGQTMAWLRSISFPSMFRSGIYLVSAAEVATVDARMRVRAAERDALVEAAVANYEVRQAETSARLGVVHNSMDYPTVAEFRSKFYFEWQWIAWETPDKLKAVSADIFEREKAKAAAQLATVADECRLAMRAGLMKLVAHLQERLQPGNDGKRKRLNASVVENLQEYLQVFELRNVTDDAELATVVAQARSVITGVDAGMIKEDDDLRARMEKELGDLGNVLGSMVSDAKGARTIVLDDES